MMDSLAWFDSLVGLLALLIGVLLHKWFTDRRLGDAGTAAKKIIADGQREADALRKAGELEAREAALKARASLEDDTRRSEREVKAIEQRILAKEEELGRKLDQLDRRMTESADKERALVGREKSVLDRESRLAAAAEEQRRKLEAIAGLTAEEAKRQLLGQMEEAARHEAALLGMRLEEEAREGARDKAREVLATTIQRLAPDYTVETAVSVVDLPSDDMKGRIIGREGRNIRALELATGVDLIVDDTPGAIILSGFDPYRREIAKQAIERLIADGRIHPARIEEVVQKVKEETDESMRKEGATVAFELGLHDLHPEIHRLMGRLKYRTSYGQNVLAHSAEVARLAGIMAREVGLDAHVAVRAAFVHDIGKAIDREMEGTHLQIGIDFLRKHGESEAVVMAMAAHHMDIDWPSLEAMIVQAADAISAARPGARRDILESYVKRLEKLEGIADSFKGVSKSFALQAGREIRIMVESEKISDEEAVWLSKDIARRIENELEYPGQIKVTVIREMRASELAR